MSVNVREAGKGILWVEIDRPEVRNALDMETFAALAAAWRRLDEDDHLRVGVVSGSGPTAFCAGADLRIVDQLADAPNLQEIYAAMLATDVPDKPIVAAVNGHCVGGGLTLLLGTDLRFAAPNATFSLPVSKLASHPKWLIPALTSQVASGVAAKMLLLGHRITAAEALTAGLISEVVALDTLRDHALSAAVQLATLDSYALRSLVSSLRIARGGWPELRSRDDEGSDAVMRMVRERGLQSLES
jgi:E-phenylitaconyl-CoA hydratase